MKKALYIGRNEEAPITLQQTLQQLGHNLEITKKAKKALQQPKHYNIFLIEVILPDMSGWELLKRLRTQTKAHIIFISPIPISTERYEALQQEGLAGYLLQPLKKTMTKEILKELLK
jgi:CheY-like chemotaxis protein